VENEESGPTHTGYKFTRSPLIPGMAAQVWTVELRSRHVFVCHSYDEATRVLDRFESGADRHAAIKKHTHRGLADQYISQSGGMYTNLHDTYTLPSTPSMHRAMTPLERARRTVVQTSGASGGSETAGIMTQDPIPTSLMLEIEMGSSKTSNTPQYPYFNLILYKPIKIVYVHVKSLMVRKEWRGITDKRTRIACVLLESLQSDLGRMATNVRVKMDFAMCMNKYIARWRQNAGRNARNQEIVGFSIMDELKNLIDERKLSVFSIVPEARVASGVVIEDEDAEQMGAEQMRAEQTSAEQMRAEQMRAEQMRAEQTSAEPRQLAVSPSV